jgi:hypothetical protein
MQKMWQAMACLACIVLTRRCSADLGPSEFCGGWLTGPILTMFDVGGLFFVGALIVTFLYPRIASVIALAACLLCLPLYLYFTMPGAFRWVFRGEYSVPLPSGFVWNRWILVGILSLCATAYICVRAFSARRV